MASSSILCTAGDLHFTVHTYNFDFDWQSLPMEMQIQTLSYLRAVDLRAVHQTNRYFWQRHGRLMCRASVSQNLMEGFAAQPTTLHAYHPPSFAVVGKTMETPKGKGGSCKKVAMRRNKQQHTGFRRRRCRGYLYQDTSDLEQESQC